VLEIAWKIRRFQLNLAGMSATEIIAELPKLTPDERQAVVRRLRQLQEEDEVKFLHDAAVEMFRDMDQRETENARRKAR